ncbi:hypothetical protein DFH08DRAFT_340609 [Mycena albidolilacea]|uniref:Uncharacterized protein n=1 Tax=Mycena albidolilacea TaxID=1033008 RepID=A0AAD7EHT8_9AGAR|nr:hypothetical protein DFH08DRAFT_340609 [Mycena albidolilacea]
MFLLLTCVLSSLFLPAACQFDGDDGDSFHPDPLTAALFAIVCIFALLYGALAIWNFVALFTSRGHRSPYAFLLPTIAFSAWSNAAYIAWIILENIPALDANSFFGSDLPVLLIPSLGFVYGLFWDWAVVLQFLVIIAVLWNRETALRTVTDGKFGGHHPVLIALHATLATLTFIFGTACEAYGMDTNVKLTNIDFDFSDYHHRILVRQQLSYVFNTFAVLMVVDVAVTTTLLWRAWKKAEVSDKITNLMLYVLVPIYFVFGLLLVIFTILFSPSGLSNDADVSVWEGANLAYSILVTGVSITILFFILALSIKKQYWNSGGVEALKQQQYWGPQAQYVYAAPPQVPQAGYYVAGPQHHTPYGQPQMYADPNSPSTQHVQYAQPYESAPGSLAAPMQTGPGSYTPPHAQPLPEKTG